MLFTSGQEGRTACAMNQQADAPARMPPLATRADLRRDMLYQHTPAIYFQDFAHELAPRGFTTTDMALKG